MPRSQRLRAGGVRPTKACASPLALTAAAQRTHRMAVLTSAAPPPNTARALPSDSRTHTTDALVNHQSPLNFLANCAV